MKVVCRWMMAALASFVLLGVGPTLAAPEFSLRAAHDGAPGNQYDLLLHRFADLVKERTNGRVEIKIFPNAQLGNELELAQGLRLGSIDFSTSSVGNIPPLIPKAGLLGLPYLIQSKVHRELLAATDGKFYTTFAKMVEDTNVGIKLLGLATAGVRNLFNSVRPVRNPDDLKGLKIRVMTSDIQVKSWKAFGAVPTPLPYSEVYTALVSGVVDGAEGAAHHYFQQKFNEGAKYFSLTEHMVAMGLFMMSQKTFDKLPPDVQDVIIKAGSEASVYERQVDDEMNTKFLAQMQEKGSTLVKVDKSGFIKRALPLHDEIAKGLGADDLLAIVREEAERAKKM
jgi:tripartite ATP-independent transporter DctP family solute receptor